MVCGLVDHDVPHMPQPLGAARAQILVLGGRFGLQKSPSADAGWGPIQQSPEEQLSDSSPGTWHQSCLPLQMKATRGYAGSMLLNA